MSSNVVGKTGTSSIDQEQENTANKLNEGGDNTPRIIGNELLVKQPNKAVDDHHGDDLFSLEREIAKIHNVDESTENLHVNVITTSNSPCVSAENIGDTIAIASNSLNNDENDTNEANYEVKVDTITLGETALEHEDLIAVLKGLDDGGHNSDGEIIEGVTIEGEGEYQIMEVIDDDTTEVEISTAISPIKTGNLSKTYGPAVVTTEEERALALEQMANIAKGRQKPRRRKQDIKPMQQADPVLDLVSSLEADWTDNDDDGSRENSTTPNSNKKETPVPVQIIETKSNVPQITSVVVLPASSSSDNKQSPDTLLSKSSSADKRPATSKENEPIEDANTSSPVEGLVVTKTNEEQQLLSSHTVTNKNKTKSETSAIPTSTITKGSTTIRPVKKESTSNIGKKAQKPVTSKENKLDTDNLNNGKKSVPSQKQSAKKEEIASDNKTSLEPSSKSASPVAAADVSPGNKRRSMTPVTNGPAGTKKKKVTELDRLMGDEGAVNMLNSLEKQGTTETKSSRPMMRSRAATICERLPRKESTSPAKTPPPTTAIQQTAKGGKRTPKPRASSGWDYVYKKKQQNIDDSMIIRRRSNSSYSSTTSLNRLSLDGPSTPSNATKSQDAKSATTTPDNEESKAAVSKTSDGNQGKRAGANSKNSPKSFEFAKPENKKTQRRTKSPATTGTLASDLKKPAPAANKRSESSPTSALDGEQKDVGHSSKAVISPTGSSTTKDKVHTSDVVVKKSSKLAQIIFSTNKAKLSHTFTTQMLNKLSDILDKLANDPDTHVTVMLTNDSHFCQGIDLTEVALGPAEKRKNAVKNLSAAVKRYLITLASYPKPLVAGVNGHIMNLGVMQLLFFDIVVAGDKCTYETIYTKIGQLPESYGVWNKLNKIRGSFKTKLFWLSEKVQSTEAALAGLVNKLTAGAKVNEEAINVARKLALMPTESYRSMKNTATQCYLEIIEETFDEEFETIAEQWSSTECLEQIKKFIDQGHF
ncbi:HP1 and insulator partner protein 1 isoform X2 [Musca autumnalis]|uniref:HP1 and insulator partner protein 1 isoform X2 n=1 Tax=Musca autumnalis TaxID=221902 RepID=UPI003CF7C189